MGGARGDHSRYSEVLCDIFFNWMFVCESVSEDFVLHRACIQPSFVCMCVCVCVCGVLDQSACAL